MQVGQSGTSASASSSAPQAASQAASAEARRPIAVADMKNPRCQAAAFGFVRVAYVEQKKGKVETLKDSNIFLTSSTDPMTACLDEITHKDEGQRLVV